MRWTWIALAAPLLGGCITLKGQVKERAAFDFKCPEPDVKVRQVQGTLGGGTFSASGCGKRRTYVGICGQNGCVVDAESAMEGGEGEEPVPVKVVDASGDAVELSALHEPPVGAAGFSFGTGVEEATERCSAAGHEMTVEGKRARCSGTADDVGFETPAELLLCDEKVCGVRLYRKAPRTPPKLAKRLTKLLDALSTRYGAPTERRVKMGGDCEEVEPCIADGNIDVHVVWKWPKGHRLSLDVVAERGLRLDYRSPKGLMGELAL